ncbi:unnamed protein product [Prorocentrum cordatum]|nr:unnamed protein product [Polarella glacialis]
MRRGTLPAKAGHQLLRPHARARGAAKEGAAGATTPEAASLEKRSGWRAFSGEALYSSRSHARRTRRARYYNG